MANENLILEEMNWKIGRFLLWQDETGAFGKKTDFYKEKENYRYTSKISQMLLGIMRFYCVFMF